VATAHGERKSAKNDFTVKRNSYNTKQTDYLNKLTDQLMGKKVEEMAEG
jgi:hypothetical protein